MEVTLVLVMAIFAPSPRHSYGKKEKCLKVGI